MAVEQVAYNAPDGATLGSSASILVGLHGSAAVQSANVTAALTTGAATALVGFASTAQLQATVDAVNSILTCLKNHGLMASS